MCTVIIHVPTSADDAVHVLAIRDEDPGRPWDAPGHWWQDTRPSVLGVRDRRSGGAWLAADAGAGRFAVLLNREDVTVPPGGGVQTRGDVVLRSVAGEGVPARPRTHGFNLVEVLAAAGARVLTWDGDAIREVTLQPGTHMIAHDDLDDPRTARIAAWLPAFAEQVPDAATAEWWHPWMSILARSAELDPTEERAIVRDNRPLGYPTLSLLVCAVRIGRDGLDVRYAELSEPGRFNALALR